MKATNNELTALFANNENTGPNTSSVTGLIIGIISTNLVICIVLYILVTVFIFKY
jgi:hypothetical protein